MNNILPITELSKEGYNLTPITILFNNDVVVVATKGYNKITGIVNRKTWNVFKEQEQEKDLTFDISTW